MLRFISLLAGILKFADSKMRPAVLVGVFQSESLLLLLQTEAAPLLYIGIQLTLLLYEAVIHSQRCLERIHEAAVTRDKQNKEKTEERRHGRRSRSGPAGQRTSVHIVSDGKPQWNLCAKCKEKESLNRFS